MTTNELLDFMTTSYRAGLVKTLLYHKIEDIGWGAPLSGIEDFWLTPKEVKTRNEVKENEDA